MIKKLLIFISLTPTYLQSSDQEIQKSLNSMEEKALNNLINGMIHEKETVLVLYSAKIKKKCSQTPRLIGIQSELPKGAVRLSKFLPVIPTCYLCGPACAAATFCTIYNIDTQIELAKNFLAARAKDKVIVELAQNGMPKQQTM